MAQPTIFGTRLKHARELRDLTQAELAAKAGISPIQVSHFETGARPSASADTLVKVANALSVSIDFLLGRAANPEPVGGNVEVVLRSLGRASQETIDAVAEIARALARKDELKRKE